MTDPNWLLSTTAQSAAALVAIVGGFLVSRVIAFSTERQGLRHRLEELRRQLPLAQSEVDDARNKFAEHQFEAFRTVAIDDYLAVDGEYDVQKSVQEHVLAGFDPDQILDWGVKLNAWVKEATPAVQAALKPGEQWVLPSELKRRGVDVDRFPDDVLDAVIVHVARPRLPPGTPPWPDTKTRALESELYQDRVDTGRRRFDRKRDAEAALSRLTGQAAVLDEQLRALTRPAGLRGAVGVLAYFSAAGIVVPLIVMSLRPVPHSWRVRALVVGLFASGLVALLGYIGWTISRAQRD